MLGLFWQFGPCSAYRIRKVFEDSPTPAWSGSTGAIYPLVRRLSRRELLRSGGADDRRGTRQRTITEAGRHALLAWLRVDAGDATLAGPPADSLRCRVSLLGVLPRRDQLAFVDTSERLLARGVEELEARLESADVQDVYTRLAEEGSLAVARARLHWLREVGTRLRASPRRSSVREEL